MAQYTKTIATAQKLIAKFGQLVQWRVQTKAVDSLKPWQADPVAVVDTEVSIVFLPIHEAKGLSTLSKTKAFQDKMLESEVATGAVYGLMGQVAFLPALNDFVLRDDEILRVVAIETLSPSGIDILHMMVLQA